MKINPKFLYLTSLALTLSSCATQKKVTPAKTTAPKPSQPTAQTPKPTTPTPTRPQVNHIGNYDFFTTNIADASKNDNTISYGSIVTAKPNGYTVTKNYFPAVAQNFRQRFIILHYTALNNDKSLSVLTQQSVSSHYLVNDLNDQEIYQLVDENKRSYHAGVSHWRGFEQLNDTSIGIEIVNPGYTTLEGKKVFVEFPEWQVKKVAALVKDIASRYQVSPTYILAHSDIAPTRKQDPGPTFPWKRLYDEYQIGMWYDEATKQSFASQILPDEFAMQVNTSPFIFKIQSMLKNFGYGIEPSGMYDDATKKTIEAFQYHFRPQLCDGIMDVETYAILQALLQKYPK